MNSAISAAKLVLIVEDDGAIRDFLRASLVAAGYRLHEAYTGAEALRSAERVPPDLVILDLGLPDLDGQIVLQRLREWFRGPILVLSARNQESQKVEALDHGADDYLTKPFSTPELLARIRVALRHREAAQAGIESPLYSRGDLRIDFATRTVTVHGTEVHLTPIEYQLLTALARSAGKVVTHRQLLTRVWGPDQVQDTHYLRVFMAGLRRKIEKDSAQPIYLLTEQGVGYRLIAES
jgi:two-component system KDP operon response regulator KdpE